jgi:hypothetical protein
MAASDDGESVDAFLERIASLKIKRDREDEERTRKLEEEILQGRRERQARRAGKASCVVFYSTIKNWTTPVDVCNRTSTIIVPTKRTHNNQQSIVCQFSRGFSLQPENATAARSPLLSSTKAIVYRAFTGQ